MTVAFGKVSGSRRALMVSQAFDLRRNDKCTDLELVSAPSNSLF